MKTLPDAIIAGKGGDSERVILVRIIPESGDAWGELLWATRDITVTDWEGGDTVKTFRGGILLEGQLGKINQSVDIEEGGNIAKVGGLTFKAVNPEYIGSDRFDQSFAGYNMENRDVEIRLVFWTGSNPTWSDTLLLFQGVVDDVSFDYGEYTIKVKDAGFKRHKNTPDLILTKDDYDEIPEQNKGKIPPLLYGEIHSGAFYLSDIHRSPMIRANKNKERFIISRNKIKSEAWHGVDLYFNDCNRWALVEDTGFTFNYGRPSSVDFPLDTNIVADFYSQLEKQGTKTDPSSLDFKNAVDQSIDTYFTLGASQKLYLKAPMPAKFAEIVNEGSNLKLRVSFGTVSGTGHLKYYNPTWDDGVGGFSTGIALDAGDSDSIKDYSIGNDKSAHGRHPTQDDQYASWEWDELVVCEFGIETDAASSAQIKNIWLYINNMIVFSTSAINLFHSEKGVPLRFGYSWRVAKPDFLRQMENIMANVDGADFGSWVDADSRDNGFNAGNLIEYGAYQIESILRDELSLISSEINYDSFDILGNDTDGDRKDWKFATVISDQKNSLEIIGEFCKICGIIYFQNYENKEKVVALKKRTAGKTIDRTTIQQGTINMKFSALNKTCNEFYLNYNKHYGNDVFEKTLFVTASDHNLSSNTRSGTPNTYTGLCSDSQDKYLKTNRLTWDCDWIRDDATAELLIKWLAEWLCYRKYIVGFETTGLDHIDLELGDQVKIDHTLLPTGVSNNDSFLLYDISYDLNNDKMKFKFIQIPDLLA